MRSTSRQGEEREKGREGKEGSRENMPAIKF